MTIQFFSTNGQAPAVDLRGAMLTGQAPDRGLYMPERIPTLTTEQRAAFGQMSYAEIATEVLSLYAEGVIDRETMATLCADAYDYDVPLEHVYDRTYVMRLDRGPTASFKDFAARMMGRLLGLFCRQQGRELIILTATSGDTGSAVASAFHGVEGIRVLVLFPVDEVSARQRKQMTTLEGNIATIALGGKFDDCQAFVKQAFADPDLADLPLSSANSINIGRLLPQSVYYLYAASRIASPEEPVLITVPSGNFGNMMGAMLARRMGLPVSRLAVPVNANDCFPQFLETCKYHKIEPSREALSNAMNVGHPSNLPRLVSLYGGAMDHTGHVSKDPDFDAMRRELFSVSVSDALTRETIAHAWEQHRLMLEPHGAVGWYGYERCIEETPLGGGPAVVIETAHPAKFPDEIEKILNVEPDLPPALAGLDDLEEHTTPMGVDYETFKQYLMDNYR